VFLHYWGGSSLEWLQVTDTLSATFRCVSLDARGSGESEAPSVGYSTVDLADDVISAIEALRITDYVLVGHSMGGKTAQLIASRQPNGLRGLALIASSPPSPMQIDQAQRDQMKPAYDTRESINFVLDNILIGSPTSPEAREQAVKDALRLSPEARDGWIEVGTREDFAQDVASINVPVVIVAGDLDKIDSLEVVRSHLAPHFKNAAVHILSQKGHLLPLEAPGEIAKIIGEFCASLSSAPSQAATRNPLSAMNPLIASAQP
jgi:pimeloyl-ACP methyl ester carboxylesterase